MQPLVDLWNGMDLRRRATLIGGLAALATILIFLSRMAAAPTYALLYSGLDPAAAGEVVTALDSRGIDYQIRGDSIHVPEVERDALRMALAGEGLPAVGAAGYELLDSLSGFGTTSQMFDAAYWRAKEGELARTIAASPRVRAARVHLAAGGTDPFGPQREPSASVSIRPVSGGISSGHAQALRYLVSSAVPGLLPENVTIIDSDSGRVLSGDDLQNPAGDAAGQADELRRSVERLLNARVGPGNAVVEVSVELVNSHETVFERIIDPNSRVVVGTESEEMANTSRESGEAAVTVASNLPDGDGAAGEGGSSTLQSSETRERVTYDVSETQRETESGPGSIRRITVAVLVNAVPVVGADGVIVRQPRPQEELAALQSLVGSTIGFDEARGDVVTIQSLAFEPLVNSLAETADGGTLFANLDIMSLFQLVALVVITLAIAFGIVRPALRVASDVDVTLPDLPPLAPNAAIAAPTAAGQSGPAMLPPASQAGPPQIAPVSQADGPEIANAAHPEIIDDAPQDADPVARLRKLIEEREEETVEILRSWMEEDGEVT